ncbi:MAG: tail fiber domain-containing protein [Bacteroidetes bacterium]|nr:tail fiber domain-containing protein [Bacteroidota bacterium]
MTVPPVGIGPGGIAKLYVSGWDNSPDPDISAFFNGDVYTPATYTPSDSSLKDNIQPYTNPFNILNQIEPKSYIFKHQTFPSLNLPHGNQIGLMANEVYDVAPHLIQGFLTRLFMIQMEIFYTI